MKKIIFNPWHDLALADGGGSFIPPVAAVEFARKCNWIGRFMRSPDGVGEEIVPWGWDKALRDDLLKQGYAAELLPSDGELDFIREASRREKAMELLMAVNSNERELGHIVSPDYRIAAHSLDGIVEFLHSRGRVVLKAPLSGSGKGIRFCTGELMETDLGWCRRVLQKQGAVIVEERLDVVQEFALLFECGESVSFRGYSLFYAANGAYKGNLLASNGFIERFLGEYVSVEELGRVRKIVERYLQEKLCGNYTGFAGVDCFVYSKGGKFFINPAVEINLRMTMGLIARNIYDFHKEEYALGDGTHCFEPLKGIFPINDR